MAERRKAYFLSDLHLGARYFTDKLAHERHAVRFLDSIKHDAAELYMLGDVLDYWYEYKTVVPRGYVRFFGKLAELADDGVKITWLTGNHDIWIFDYLPSELGVEVVDDAVEREIMGKCFYMAHGDRTGTDSASFRFIQSFFRNRLCQKLFSAVHPRWTVPFAYKWSSTNRASHSDAGRYMGVRHSLLMLSEFCTRYLEAHPEVDYFIFGHLHEVSRQSLPFGKEMIVIGDWIDHFSYLEFDGKQLALRYFPMIITENVEKEQG